MRQQVVRLWLFVSLVPLAAWAQAPTGSEFQVNTTTFVAQSEPAVAADSAGNFVVVWQSALQDGDALGVFGQRFNAQGLPRGSEFQVNTFIVADQAAPAVAFPAPGTFVVVWHSRDQDGSALGVFGQLFDALGAPQGPEFRVNTSTAGSQRNPSIAAAAGGGFVVAWESEVAASNSDVFAQRYDAAGTPLGGEFQVNTFTGGEQRYPSVAADAAGNFVVGWQSAGQDGSGYGIFGQRFNDQGVPQGAEFAVNSFTTGAQRFPSVASDATGNLLVAWDSEAQDGSGRGIFAQRFNPAGVPQGPEFWFQTYVAGDQSRPSVSADPSGAFFVSWEGVGGPDDSGVFGRFFDSSGLFVGPRFLINTHTLEAQAGASVAATAHGGFVAIWQSDLQDGSEGGVYAQRFSDLIFRDGFEPANAAPVAVDDAFDVDEDGTLAGTSVLDNDTDPESDGLTAALVSDVSSGDLTFNPDGTFEYTPDPDFNGTDSFTYYADDGTQPSNVATVTLTVNAVNDAPTATPKVHSTHSGIRITIGAASIGKLLEGATDPDDLPGDLTANATFTSVTPAGATVTLLDPATGTFTYNPPAGYSGAASFQFTVCDDGVPVAPSRCSAPQTVSFTVTGPDLWFVNSGAPGGGTGRLTDPFNSLMALTSGRGTGDRIFVASGTYAGAIHNFQAAEWLVGQGASGSFDVVLGVTVPGNGTLDPRPALGGVAPTLGSTIAMATGGVLAGVAISTSAALPGFVANAATNITVLQTSVSSLGATAVSISASTASVVGVNFTSTTANSNFNGIVLANVDGVFNFGGGSLTNHGIAAFTLTNTAAHAPTITYAGSITPAPNARAVDIGGAGAGSGLTGGSVTLSGALATSFSGGPNANAGGVRVRNGNAGALTFSGANKTFNAGPNHGVELATNPGVTISFTGGGLDIDTTSGTGFTATGGGTVVVTAGSNANTIDSTTGTALNVANTTIGGAGLTFQRLSSNGGTATGIILDTTGALGGLTVNGDGTNTAVGGNGSGGTIANKSGADNSNTTGSGIYLNSTSNVVLRRMTINGTNQNFGIRGNNVNGFTLEYATVGGTNGTAASLPAPENYGEGSVYFGNATGLGLTGSATITSCNISGGRARNLSVVNAGGTLNRLTITGTAFGLNQSTGNQALAAEARNAGTVLNATLTGSTFSGSPGDLINFTGQTGTTMDVIVQNNTLTNTHPQNNIGGGGVTLATQGVMTLNYSNNTQSGANGSAITLQKASAGTLMSGTLNGNTIGVSGVAGSGSQTGNGIFFSFAGGGQITLAVTNNTIRQYAGNAGIYADNTGGNYNLDLTATGNTTAQPGAGAFAGLALAAGAPASGDDIDVCANVTGNNFSAGDPVNANDVILGVSTGASSMRLPGYAGATLAAVQSFVLANNNVAGTVVTAYVDAPATAANFVGGGPCLTP